MTLKEIKNKLTDKNIIELVEDIGGDYSEQLSTDEYILFSSILYHKQQANEHSYKMYYYRETKQFHDYKLGESFDIFELIQRMKSYKLPQAKEYVCTFCGFKQQLSIARKPCYQWASDFITLFEGKCESVVELKYDKEILKIFEKKYHISWIKENITKEVMNKYDILYEHNKIIIPVKDIEGNLIGIRYRTLKKDDNFKYKPYTDYCGMTYTFKTRNTFYGLYENAENIRKAKEVILFESEKSVLQCESYLDKNISLGLFGKELSQKKINILLGLGVQTVNIGIDFDYKDKETLDKYFKNVYNVYKKLKPYFNVYWLFNNDIPSNYKDSPTDNGKLIFLEYLESRRLIEKEEEIRL